MSHMGFWDSVEKSVLIDGWFCNRHAHREIISITDSDRDVTLMKTKAEENVHVIWPNLLLPGDK